MATFNPFFAAQFEQPVAYQLMGVIQRDQRAALDYVGGTNVLPSFLEYNFAYYPPTQWPAVLLAVQDNTFTNPSVVQAREQRLNIEITVAVSNADRNQLVLQAWQYLRAIDLIVASLGAQVNPDYLPNFNDFYNGNGALPLVVPFPSASGQSVINTTTAGVQAGSVRACYPTNHRFSEIARPQESWEMTASLNLRVELTETLAAPKPKRTVELLIDWTAAIPKEWHDFEVKFAPADGVFSSWAGSKFMALVGSHLRSDLAQVHKLFDGLIAHGWAKEVK